VNIREYVEKMNIENKEKVLNVIQKCYHMSCLQDIEIDENGYVYQINYKEERMQHIDTLIDIANR